MIKENQNICDYHGIIKDRAYEIQRLKAKNYDTVEDLLSEVVDLVDDIYSAVDYALEAGQKMESRLREYREAIEGLGFIKASYK